MIGCKRMSYLCCANGKDRASEQPGMTVRAESDGRTPDGAWARRRMRQRETHTSYHKSLKAKQRQYERIKKERNREDGAAVYRQRAHSTPRHSRRAELLLLLKT